MAKNSSRRQRTDPSSGDSSPLDSSVGSRMRKRSEAFKHWQTWLGLVVCGLCGAAGQHVGLINGHPSLGAAIGGAFGGYMLHVAIHYGSRRA